LFDTYEEFKTHIIDTHEESREYITCPLERCKAPVRDLHIHFKSKHPYDKLPKGIQLRASVWRDVKQPNKRRKTFSFKEGTIISVKNKGKAMHYRSGYELEVYESLEKINEVVSYDVEPFPVEYFWKGRSRNYYPDIIVRFKDRVEVWEVKPAKQTSNLQNQAKWDAAKFFCETRGWKFVVYTEKEIKILKRQTE
jgi:hypothetical protein